MCDYQQALWAKEDADLLRVAKEIAAAATAAGFMSEVDEEMSTLSIFESEGSYREYNLLAAELEQAKLDYNLA